MTLQDPTTIPADDLTGDQAEIISVIRAETAAFAALDFDAWCACWTQNPRTQEVYSSETSGVNVLRGWDAVSDNMRHVMENQLECGVVTWDLSTVQISVSAGMAWATFDCLATYVSGSTVQNFEARILERTPHGWKIAFSQVSLHHGQGPDASVRVDSGGQISWAAKGALDILKAHPLLTISAGRIRAHRLDWDKTLQAALSAAGDYHGFFELHRLARETGSGLRYPLILGETEDGGVAAVHLTAKDGATYIALDERAATARRLAAAKAVFGLSDAQFRTASLIAEGHGLPRVAEAMEISVNTVRTHLNRLYEKTGVNAQTALVRLLLSVG